MGSNKALSTLAVCNLLFFSLSSWFVMLENVKLIKVL